jgi:hypothetical protein
VRVDDSTKALVSGDLAGVNLSTYFLFSNLYVTRRTFAVHPILGTGLGSNEVVHAEYIGSAPGMAFFIGNLAYNASNRDAGSLFLRITAEFGLVGIVAVAFLLYRYRPSEEEPYAAIGFAVLLYLFLKLFRNGHYFTPEMYFFIWSYVFSSARFRRREHPELMSYSAMPRFAAPKMVA